MTNNFLDDMQTKNKKGFTLIELLVVIAIIGLLATLAVTSLNSARVKARDARRLADIESIRKALELIYDENGTYAVTCSSNEIDTCDMSPYLTAANVGDPLNSAAACDGSNDGACNYAFWQPPTGQHYWIYFHLEKITSLGNQENDNCLVDKNGIRCLSDVSMGGTNGFCLPENIDFEICNMYDLNRSGHVSATDRIMYHQ